MSRITTLRRQLSLSGFLAKLAAEAARKLFNRDSAFTYAQDGEDILAMSLLGWPMGGFFVDVGCNLPRMRSNTYLFYLRGAWGIGIDANGAFATAWAKSRPRDTFVEACIGHGEEVEFHTFKSHTLSSVGGAQVDSLSDEQYSQSDKRRMTTVPLQTLLERHAVPKVFDLLSIDVEGYDEVVLDTIDLNEWRPRLIVVEAHSLEALTLADHPLVRRVCGAGYTLVALQKSNLFFLDDA